jgi:hypothetical protein
MIILIRWLTTHLTRKCDWATLLDRGHECQLLMMAYDSIDQWAIVRQRLVFDTMRHNGASMK